MQEECFSLWLTQWASIYEEESPSRELIESIHGSFFLVAVVDDNYIDGDIFAFFDAALATLRTDAALM